jgi:hypothetical protein
MDMRELALRIARAEYVVDIDAVTSAILRRIDVDEEILSAMRADGPSVHEGPSRPTG